MFNATQGVDAIFGGFAAGMQAIRQRDEERSNEEYFLNRLTEIQDWGQEGWDRYERVHAAYTKVHAVLVGCKEMNARLQWQWVRDHREIDALKAEIARLRASR